MVLWRMGPGPTWVGPAPRCGHPGGGYPPLQAQAVARGGRQGGQAGHFTKLSYPKFSQKRASSRPLTSRCTGPPRPGLQRDAIGPAGHQRARNTPILHGGASQYAECYHNTPILQYSNTLVCCSLSGICCLFPLARRSEEVGGFFFIGKRTDGAMNFSVLEPLAS